MQKKIKSIAAIIESHGSFCFAAAMAFYSEVRKRERGREGEKEIPFTNDVRRRLCRSASQLQMVLFRRGEASLDLRTGRDLSRALGEEGLCRSASQVKLTPGFELAHGHKGGKLLRSYDNPHRRKSFEVIRLTSQ